LAFGKAGFGSLFRLEDLLHVSAGAGIGSGQRRTAYGKLLAFDDQLDLGGVEGFALQQGLGHAVHDVVVGVEDGVSRLVGRVDELADLGVDLAGGVFRVVAGLAGV